MQEGVATPFWHPGAVAIVAATPPGLEDAMRLFKRRKPATTTCPRCSQLVSDEAVTCPMCGWDLRDAYQGPGVAGAGHHDDGGG